MKNRPCSARLNEDDDRRSRLVFVVHEIPSAEILDAFAFATPVLWQTE